MNSVTRISNKMIWVGRIVSIVPALFMLMDGIMKLIKPPFVVTATIQLGYPESVIVPLGIVVTASTILYLIPRTSVLGAILLTGYLGGAVATQVRISAGLFLTFFPVVFGILLWGGLWFQNEHVRSLIPLQR